MSYSYSFVPNNTYGAEDINNITKRLVTSGVEDVFEDGVAYNVSHLNTISSVFSTKGVIPEGNTSLKVVNNGKVNDEYTVTILEGTAFFENGSTITITDGGETLPYTYGQKNYVYVQRDLNLNQNMPKVTLTEPEGDYVPLAEISETGEITDTRILAKGKLPGYQSDFNNSKRIISTTVNGKAEIDLGGTNYGLMLINIHSSNNGVITSIPVSTILMVNGELNYNVCIDGSTIRRGTDLNLLLISYSFANPVTGSLVIEDGKLKLNFSDSTRVFDIDTYLA